MIDILIYDVISPDKVSAKSVQDELSKITADTVHVRLNTPGGSVTEGIAIETVLKRSGKKIITHIDGIAASMGFYLFMLGEQRYVNEKSSGMIHNAGGGISGTGEQIEQYGKFVTSHNNNYAKLVSEKTGKSEDEIKALMESQTWFIGQEMIDEGYATALEPAIFENIAAMIEPFAESLKQFSKQPGNIAESQDKGEQMKAELSQLFSLDAEAKDSVYIEKVKGLHSRAELVPQLEAKLTEVKAELQTKTTALKDLQAKIATFEVDKVVQATLEAEGVKMSAENMDALKRRAERLLNATDETVKADMKADMTTFAKLHGVPVGTDPNLSGNGGEGRQDSNAEAQLHARAVAIQVEARKQGREVDYSTAIKQAVEVK